VKVVVIIMSEKVHGTVLPGQKVAETVSSLQSGYGVYEKDGYFIASLPGTLIQSSENVISVQSLSSTGSHKKLHTQVIPAIGQDIIGKIVKINSKYAGVDILAVDGELPLMEPIKGTIRTQDIVEVDEKEIPPVHLAFRPGDLVRARMIGIGDPSAGYLLSTGVTPHLGVIYGKSAAAGAPMLPYAWNEMICSQTGIKEKRKCAKPKSS
jgi:exosome complex component CSL4